VNLTQILRGMVQQRASDLFLKWGSPPAFRIDGSVRKISLGGADTPERLEDEFLESLTNELLSPTAREILFKRGEADAAHEVEGLGRFRINAFRERGRVSFVFRYIPREIPTIAELNLPEKQLKKLAEQSRGLVLVTGTAGSGKSTCMASMLDWINQTQHKHIITIEDPIEFVFEHKRSIISQRELVLDTESFENALKFCMRQSPDVIMIGEMRDRETMEAAINAAETGHLVFSTLHTVNAIQTVERIIGYFPPHLHDLIRLQLSLVLKGVVSLRLLRRGDSPGRIPAVELLVSTPTIQELLEEGKTRQINKALREGEYYGTQTFSQSLKSLLDRKIISEEDALHAADSADELKL